MLHDFDLTIDRHSKIYQANSMAVGTEDFGFNFRASHIANSGSNGSPPLRRFCGACCPDANPRRWAPSLVTRFEAAQRVAYNYDLILSISSIKLGKIDQTNTLDVFIGCSYVGFVVIHVCLFCLWR